MSTIELIFGFISLAILFHWFTNRNSDTISWPIIGMLPEILWNTSSLHENASEALKRSRGTFEFKGPWFTDHDFLLTSDPANVHHMLSKNFSNYPSGDKFKAIFDPLFGDGIIAADSDLWKFQRKMLHSYLHDAKFQVFLEKCVKEKVANGLIPVLDHVCVNKMEVHLNDVLLRLGFDIICSLFLGRDPKCLSPKFPEDPYQKAFDDLEKALIHRNVMPEIYWNLLKWLQIGQEKKLSNGLKIINDFVYETISSKRDEASKTRHIDSCVDFLTTYLIQEEKEWKSDIKSGDKFIRDIAVNLLMAGRDTSSAALSWFFFLLDKNPGVETRILEEIRENNKNNDVLGLNEANKLVYLHATLCETLRLYPTVPVNPRCALGRDKLPSGHWVKEGAKVFIYFYPMGRMEELWGEDCNEFKPERWISSDGGLVHVPSNKFTAFGAGPRSCLGKDMSFIQMKMIAATIISRYRIKVVGDRPVVPSNSMVLHMKHGLKVRVTKRSFS